MKFWKRLNLILLDLQPFDLTAELEYIDAINIHIKLKGKTLSSHVSPSLYLSFFSARAESGNLLPLTIFFYVTTKMQDLVDSTSFIYLSAKWPLHEIPKHQGEVTRD